jgi:hypothetical protein
VCPPSTPPPAQEQHAEAAIQTNNYIAMAKVLNQWSVRGVTEHTNMVFKRVSQRLLMHISELEKKVSAALATYYDIKVPASSASDIIASDC